MSIIGELAKEIEKPLRKLAEVLESWYELSGIEEIMPDTQHKLALKYYASGDVIKAAEHFEECLKVHSIYGLPAETRANCANYLAQIFNEYRDFSRDDEVSYYLRYAVENSPNNAVYRKNLASYYLSVKAYSKAYEHFKLCSTSDSENSQVLESSKEECVKMLGMLEALGHHEAQDEL